MRIIPAIDIIDGKCVRLSKGDYTTKKIYDHDPVEVAKRFYDHGIEYLHVVDLDGAKSNHIVNYKVLESICQKTTLQVDFGGGVKTDQDLQIAFESGASQVTVGSIAQKNPNLFLSWLDRFGNEKIILGADCRDRKIATSGWLESSEVDVVDFISDYEKHAIKYVICTDISKDGMLKGASVDLYRDILHKTNIQLIASGGISNIDDLLQLKELGCEGAIIGKAIYEGKISLQELADLC